MSGAVLRRLLIGRIARRVRASDAGIGGGGGVGDAAGGPAVDSALNRVDRSGDDRIARRVSAVGVVCVAWQQISVGKHRAGRTVDIQVGPELLHIWDGHELLKTALRDNTKEVRKKRASVAH